MRNEKDKIKRIISQAAQAAADNVMQPIPHRDSPARKNTGHPTLPGGWLGQKQIGEEIVGLHGKQKEAVASAYLNRQKKSTDPVWLGIKEQLPDNLRKLPHLKLLAICKRYWEEINQGKSSTRKATNAPGWMDNLHTK